jgi:hypothetical protein
LPDTAERDHGPVTANEQSLVTDEAEAHRIVAEWATYTGCRNSGPDDPDARFFVAVINTFAGT